MIVDVISDLHGHYPKLEGGDLLIVAGDLTAQDTQGQHNDFREWVSEQNYKCKLFIGGNHDNYLTTYIPYPKDIFFRTGTYLCDSGCEFEGLKIWGSPWTLAFKDMNPKCKAFTCKTEAQLERKFEKIPGDTDILVTHSPPWGIFDECVQGNQIKSVGSRSLRAQVMCIAPALHVFGHIHENGGQVKQSVVTKFVNASHVDEWYRPINKPVRVIL